MIVGLGFDIVAIKRFERLIQRYDDRLLNKLFTAKERAYCQCYADPAQHFAARFAVKEAALKMLGVPSRVRWQDLEVISLPSGEPRLLLHNQAAKVASQRDVGSTWISISHEQGMAAAVVVAEAAAEHQDL